MLALIGENGAGKSTLLSVIAGALTRDAGEIQARPRSIAYIRQELSLFPHLSVAENIFMGREPARYGFIDRVEMRARALALLCEFGRPEIDPEGRALDLPPASRQVVEICRALARDAQVILMDEPTSSLQRADVERLFASIRGVCARGVAVVYVSHFLEEVREIASRAVVLRDGRSVWSGTLAEISDEGLIGHMIGRQMGETVPGASTPSTAEVALEIDGLAGVTLSVRRGEILGIAGLVGSGRTEFMRALFGLSAVREGRVTIGGETIGASRLSAARMIGLGVGYLSEDRNVEGLFPHLSVRENITMARLGNRDVSPWIARLGIKTSDVDGSIRQLSGGNQQKALLARILHQGADILLLDEPTRGIDVGTKAEIYDLIRSLAAEGRAVILVSSYLPELFSVCQRLAVMTRGRLSEARPIEAWTPDLVLESAIGGAAAA